MGGKKYKPFWLGQNKDSQCIDGVEANTWDYSHYYYNNGNGMRWSKLTATGMGYFKREDIPIQWDIVDGWTILDMNMQSILSCTDPNRIMWMSGTIRNDSNLVITNPNPTSANLVGTTFPELLEEANISWKVWQDVDDYQDNMLAYFKQYQHDGTLQEKGASFTGLEAFYKAAQDGTLPSVSYIIGPQSLTEHPPYSPRDGGWFQRKVVEAVTNGKGYAETVLIISYDGKIL